MSEKAAGPKAEVVAPPPFGTLKMWRDAPGGRIEARFLDEAIVRITGSSVDAFMAGPAGRALLAEARDLFARADRGSAHADSELFLGDGVEPTRRLHARLQMRIGIDDEPIILVVVHDLTGYRGVRPLQRERSDGSAGVASAILRIDRDPDGELRLRLIDEAIRQVIGGGLAVLLGTPAERAMLARAAELIACESWSAASPRNDLPLPPVDGSDRVLHARFVRVASPGGEPSVTCIVSDMTPMILGEQESARRSGALLRLLRLSEILLEQLPVETGLERIVDEIAAAPGFGSVAIGFLDDTGKRLVVRAHRGIAGRPAGRAYFRPISEGPCRLAMEERRTVVSRRPDPATTCLFVPIIAANNVLGLLEICAEMALPWGAWDEEIVGSFADYIAAFVTGTPPHPRALQGQPAKRADTIDLVERLTRRQRQVLFFLVDASASNREIAERLGVTEATVKVHMRAIMSRLGVANRTEVVHLVFSRAAGWLAEARARRHYRPSPDRSAA